MAWQCISQEVTVKGFKKCIYPMKQMGLMMICCEMTVKRMGMLRVSVRNMKALTVKMETVSLIGKVSRI
jgi:hypothetical protein